MNQQLIFNTDYSIDPANNAVVCSCLQAGLRITVYIRKPAGWLDEVWLAQVKEEQFYWEDQIEAALQQPNFDQSGALWLDGAAF